MANWVKKFNVRFMSTGPLHAESLRQAQRPAFKPEDDFILTLEPLNLEVLPSMHGAMIETLFLIADLALDQPLALVTIQPRHVQELLPICLRPQSLKPAKTPEAWKMRAFARALD